MANITMKNLLEAGVHFGHQTRRWNPKMDKHIFGSRNNIHIIDLQQTVRCLKEAYRYLKEEAALGKTFLFVGTKRQAQDSIKDQAEKSGMYYINYRWLGGTLTNFETIKNSIKRLTYLEDLKNSSTWDKLSKKEVARLTKEYQKLEKTLCGIKDMPRLPEIAIIIDPENEMTAVKECRKLNIPIVSILDTDCNPDVIDVGVPGNDDAIRAIRLFLSIFTDAINEGKEIYTKVDETPEKESTPEEVVVAEIKADAKPQEEKKVIKDTKTEKEVTQNKKASTKAKVVKKSEIK
ncbi:MAG: 30S ribosomal protein S2 [bacterium]|nr:30S ribosomal protein S2 [bacterium]